MLGKKGFDKLLMKKYHDKEQAVFVKRVKIIVSELERSVSFYTKVIGLTLIDQENDVAYLGVDDKNVLLSLKEIKGAKRAFNNIGLYHFALLVENRSVFAHLLKHLVDLGYPLTGLSDHGISEAIYLQDPDNNGVEIAADRFDSEGNVYRLETFGPKEIDVYDLMKHLPREPFTKLPATTILGHLHLHVNDMKRAKQFFVNGLGFDVRFDYRGVAVFTSSQSYHHHLAFNIWNGTEARRRGLMQAGLESYVLSAPKDKFNAIKQRLNEMGYPTEVLENSLEVFDVNGDKVIIEAA
jgi:catechol 2,3-dioxygenase